jgi:hypothetical protein
MGMNVNQHPGHEVQRLAYSDIFDASFSTSISTSLDRTVQV